MNWHELGSYSETMFKMLLFAKFWCNMKLNINYCIKKNLLHFCAFSNYMLCLAWLWCVYEPEQVNTRVWFPAGRDPSCPLLHFTLESFVKGGAEVFSQSFAITALKNKTLIKLYYLYQHVIGLWSFKQTIFTVVVLIGQAHSHRSTVCKLHKHDYPITIKSINVCWGEK